MQHKNRFVRFLLPLLAALCVLSALPFSSSAEPAFDPRTLYVRDGLVMELLPENADLAASRWYDSEDRNVYATFTGSEWTKNGDSVGFRLTEKKKVNLNFGIDLLPEGSYTFEMVLRPFGLTNADGTPQYFPDEGTYAQYGYEYGIGFAFGPLKAETFPALRSAANNKHQDKNFGSHQNRWIYQAVGGWAEYGKAHSYVPKYADNSLLATDRITWSICWEQEGKTGTYTFRHNGNVGAFFGIPEADFAPLADCDGCFFVLESFPADVYAVRLYDRALTEDEQMQNALVDLALATGLDLSGFAAATPATRRMALRAMAGASAGEPVADLQSRLDDALLIDTAAWEAAFASSFYVKDGITRFFSAVGEYRESALIAEGNLTWFDLATGDFVAFGGGVWQKTARGIATAQSYADYKAKGHNYGIILDGTVPEGDFTVDMAIAPTGLTNPDGSVYLDSQTQYGTFHDYGFVFGAAKALVFPTKRPDGMTGNLEKRWFYQGIGGWDANKYNELFHDTSFKDFGAGNSLSFAVRFSRQTVLSSYTVLCNGETYGKMTVDTVRLIPNADTEGMFRMMYGYPSEFFAVRVYDRALTNAELLQNHFADLVSLYGWDADFLRSVLSMVPSQSDFFALFGSVGFDLGAEEANAALLRIVSSVWMEYVGISARTDGIGLRGVFRLNTATLQKLEQTGATVECGIVFTVPAFPESNARVAVYRTEGGVCTPFVIGEENGFVTVALSAAFRNPTTAMMLADCSFRGYVRVTQNGVETVYETAASNPDLASVFRLYSHLTETSYASNARMRAVADRCYTSVSFTVDPAATKEGDGSVESPFATLKVAFAAVEARIAESDVPVAFTVSLLPGTHLVDTTVTFAPKGAPYRLTVAGDGATVAGWQEISGADFTPVPGSREYVYTFESAPAFRYLYVDGELTEPATSGDLTAESGTQYRGLYKNGVTYAGGTEAACTDPKLYLAKELFVGMTDGDLGKLEVHIETNWKYYVCHVTNVDFDDTTPDGDAVAVWLDPDEYAKVTFVSTMVDCFYWIQNGSQCLDESGEFLLRGTELRYLASPIEDMNAKVFGIPTVETLLYLEDVTNVTFTGITFTGADARSVSVSGHKGEQAGMAPRASNPEEVALRGKNVARLSLRDCVFTQLPGDGVWVSGAVNGFTVEGCRFLTIGATAIRVGKGDGMWNEKTNATRNVLLSDNEVNGAALLFRECCAIAMGVGYDVEIANNTVHNCSYSGISVGWSWNSADWEFGRNWHLYSVSIHDNYITDFMTEMRDGGAIYTLGGNVAKSYTDPFNEVYNNYIVVSRKTGDGRNYFMCLYHDGASSNWYTFDNIIVENPDNRKFDGKSGQVYIHLQQGIGATSTSTGQAAFNITVDHCYVINVESKTEDGILTEIFGGPKRVDESRGLYAFDMQYLASPEELDDFGRSIIDGCGSNFCPPNYDDILSGNY